jgi:hypothetical protein
MKTSSATKIETLVHVDLEDLDDVIGGKHHSSSTTTQTSNVTQNGSVTIDLSGAGDVSSFFCPSGSGNTITIGSTQNATVDQEAN